MNAEVFPSPPRRRGRISTVVRYGGIALLLLVAGMFVARRQIGNLLARELDKQLAAAGVYLTWESADWIQRNGIEVGGLALFRDAAKTDRLALLSSVTVIKGTPGWDRWDTFRLGLADARLILGNGANETTLEHLDMTLNLLPGKVALTNCHASAQGLRIEMKGDWIHQPAGTTTPTAPPPASRGRFADVKLDWLKNAKEWVKFKPGTTPPVLKVDFQPQPNSNGLELAATLDGTNFQWRGQKWDLVQADAKTTLGGKPSLIVINRLRVGRDGRTGQLTATYDPAKEMIRIADLDSGIDALTLTRALAPDSMENLKGFTTHGGWHLTGGGEVPLKQPENSRWNGRATLDGELVLTLGGTHYEFIKPSFNVGLLEKDLLFSDVRADLWEGVFDMPEMRIHLPSGKSKTRFDARFTLEDARLRSVMASFKAREEQPGVVHFNWKGGGEFARDAITGEGALSIREAEFYRVPLFGPLNIVFDQLTPGFARDVATSLTSRHRIAGGTVHIEDLKLESTLTLIDARGTIDLASQYARLTAQAKMRGIAGLATFLVSALLEMEGEGPVDNVQWKLDHLPGGGLIKDAAGIGGKAGGVIIEGAGEVLKDTGEAAKDLFKLPGKLLPRK